jgi:hypothetical protein
VNDGRNSVLMFFSGLLVSAVYPVAGNQCTFTANSRTRTTPRMKLGTERKAKAIDVEIRSSHPLGR